MFKSDYIAMSEAVLSAMQKMQKNVCFTYIKSDMIILLLLHI